MALNTPLAIPEGSVRAIIALILIISTVIFFYLGIEIPEWYYALVVSFLGYYIGTRSVNGSNGNK